MAESDKTPPEGDAPSTDENTAEEKLPYDPKKTYTYQEARKIGRAGVPLGTLARKPLSPQDRARMAEIAAIERVSRLSIEAHGTKIGGDGCACGSRHRRKKHKG